MSEMFFVYLCNVEKGKRVEKLLLGLSNRRSLFALDAIIVFPTLFLFFTVDENCNLKLSAIKENLKRKGKTKMKGKPQRFPLRLFTLSTSAHFMFFIMNLPVKIAPLVYIFIQVHQHTHKMTTLRYIRKENVPTIDKKGKWETFIIFLLVRLKNQI